MRQPVFIGPVCVGKTTVSTLVASLLGVPRVELDEVADAYYRSAPGFDPPEYERLLREEGFVAAYRYWEPALVDAVQRVVADHPDSLLDLGAGHSCYLDRSLFERVRAILEPFTDVVLLLPDPDPELSIGVIRARLARERDGWDWVHGDVDFVRHWVTSDQNRLLADHVVYAGEDDPPAVAERVAALVA